MIKEGKFGVTEAVCMTTLFMTSKFLFTGTSVVTQLVGTAGWYMTLISGATALVGFLLIYVLVKRFPGMDIAGISVEVLGGAIGRIFIVILVAYSIYYAGSNLREFVEMIKAYNLPYTKSSIIMICFLAVCLLGVYKGIEAIARTSYLLFFGVITGLIILLLLAMPTYHLGYLRPYFGYGIRKTVYIGILRSSAYSEVFLLPVIANSLQGLKNFKKTGILSIILTSVLASVSLFCYIMAFSFSGGQENLSGVFELSKMIYFNRFFQRVESLFLFTWITVALLTVSLSLYIAISLYCKGFKIKNHRPLLIPLGFLAFMAAMLPENLSEVIQINMLIIRQYSSGFIIGSQLLILLVALIRRKKGGKISAKKD